MPAELVTKNLLVLPRLLRRAGVHVDAERSRLFLRALAEVDLGYEEDVRAAARASLVMHQGDLAPFEEAFDLFWALLRGASPPADGPARRSPRNADDRADVPLAPLPGALRSETRRAIRLAASAVELLRHTDFAAMTADERAAAARFLERLEWSPGPRRSRRFRAARNGPRLDARATMRRSLRTQGEPVLLVRRAPRTKRRPLVILCDVSGSMEIYTRLLLHMSHALARRWGLVETFTFGTRLTRVTRQLRERRPDTAIARVSRAVADWSGGTRIGDALGDFNVRWSRRVLGRGAVILLVTDGWERGDPARLAAEATRLQRAAYRLIWLDPLSGTRGYTPESAGALSLLRHVDDHLPANTLDGLSSIAGLLATVGRGRPVRHAEAIA